MVGLVHLTRPNATEILVGADGHGREAQTNVGPPSFFSKDDLFKHFIKSDSFDTAKATSRGGIKQPRFSFHPRL